MEDTNRNDKMVNTILIIDKNNGKHNFYVNADGTVSQIRRAEELQESNIEYLS